MRTYAVESLLVSNGRHDRRAHRADRAQGPDPSAALAALEEYAIEASIAKVAGSEVLNDVLDENIQVHGGNGYVRDYPAERHYRDSRVNRIFEGTNEINRLLISGILVRRAVKGELPVIAAAKALQDELMGTSPAPGADDAPLAARATGGRGVQEDRPAGRGTGASDLRPETVGRAGSADATSPTSSSTFTPPTAPSFVLAWPRPRNRRARRFTSMPPACSSAMRRCASTPARGRRWPQWPRATICGLPSPRCAGCRRSHPINTVVLRRRLADEAVARGGYIF